MLPNKPRGVRRVDDRRVLNGIFWVLRSGAPWRDLPAAYGPRTTCYNRFVRWRRAGVWDQIMDALAAGYDAAGQMIDTSVVRMHQHGACVADNNHQYMGRSRGGLTSKIHAVVDTNGLPPPPAMISSIGIVTSKSTEQSSVRASGKSTLRIALACERNCTWKPLASSAGTSGFAGALLITAHTS